MSLPIGREEMFYSLAGLLVFGLMLVLFAPMISEFLANGFITIINATTLLTNSSTTYNAGGRAYAVGKPNNPFLAAVIDSIAWLASGIINVLGDPLLFSLIVILTLIVIVVQMQVW